MRKWHFILSLIMILISFTGCSNSDEYNTGKIQLKLAVFEDNSSVAEQVKLFNETNSSYEIIIEKYERSTVSSEDGILQIQREIVSGTGPDIINYGCQYSTSDIVGEYTEDLTSFLDNNTSGTDSYFQNILQSFHYNDGLYAIPIDFTLNTFVGNSTLLQGVSKWDISQMMWLYDIQEENILLYPGQTQRDVFGTILTGCMETFIDWEKGICIYDSEEFGDILRFSKQFPEKLLITEEYSSQELFMNDQAMVLPCYLENVYDVAKNELIFGSQNVVYVGFPMENGSGTLINPGDVMLAINSMSKHKEQAWEFISQFLSADYQQKLTHSFPIRKDIFEDIINEGLTVSNEPRESLYFEGEKPLYIYNISEEQSLALNELISNASYASTIDYNIYNIIMEEAEAYWSNTKTLHETQDIIQNRISLYISEKK